MTITMLDPTTALIIVDLQNGLAGSAFIHPIDDIVTRACDLIAAFRRRSLPIVLVNVDGTAPGRTERPRHTVQSFRNSDGSRATSSSPSGHGARSRAPISRTGSEGAASRKW